MTIIKKIAVSKNIDLQIFLPAMIVIIGLMVPISISPESAGEIAGNLIGIITKQLGWLYLMGAFMLFALMLWLAFGRYGMVRLGRESDTPDYSKFSWLAMMFCAGMGSSIMNWAFIEPLYFMQGPALGIEAGSSKAAEWAVMYSFFHWGLIPYAIYLMPALPIAYMVYVKRCNLFRISEACVGFLGNKAYGPIGKIIDILVIFSILGGTATTLGLSVPVLSALFSEAFGVADSFALQVVALVLWTAIFTWSVYRGLSKGIQILSQINTVLALVLIAVVFVTGPTLFILDLTTNSLGLLANNFLQISLSTDPIEKGGYPQAWTTFYWAWWLAYAPMVGLFVARISKGRTVRELILNGFAYGSLGSWIFFAVWGGYSVHTETSGVLQLSSILSESGLPTTIVSIVKSQPFSYFFILSFIVLFLIFTATTMDSAAYVLASVSSKNLAGNEEPTRFNRIAWALVLGAAAVAMLLMGGLKAVQSASIVLALPMLFLMAVLVRSFMQMLKEDHGLRLEPIHHVLKEHEITAVSEKQERALG
ncbi:BCCT family transporter [Marinobacterium maritimum]|uniref:BCCT family transporter n=1 Tax=Marinobacterium maritimum TaxID=500162 RepID=A0ABP3T8H5_9GAMM